MRKDETAAVSAAAALLNVEEQEEETTDEAAGQGAEEAVQQGAEEEQEEQFPNFDVELPEDLLAELEEEEPSVQSVTEELETEEEYQLLDDDQKRLLARARAAERKAEWLEAQRVKDQSKSWRKEAEKFFPLATPFLDEIDSKSRKGYLREAKATHDKLLPIWKETATQQRASIEKERERIRDEERAAAKKQWGSNGGSTTEPTDATTAQEDIKRYREKKDLAGTIRTMIFGGTDG